MELLTGIFNERDQECNELKKLRSHGIATEQQKRRIILLQFKMQNFKAALDVERVQRLRYIDEDEEEDQ